MFRIDAGAQSKRRGSFPEVRDIASDTGSGTRLGDAGEEVKRKGVGRRLDLVSGLFSTLKETVQTCMNYVSVSYHDAISESPSSIVDANCCATSSFRTQRISDAK